MLRTQECSHCGLTPELSGAAYGTTPTRMPRSGIRLNESLEGKYVNKNEKLKHYARARKPTAVKITQIEGGMFVTSWVGKLRGMIVSAADGTYKHATKEAALACAEDFRQRCRNALEARGIAL